MTTNLSALKQKYSDALLQDVIPFWQNYSPDNEYGGYFTCLNRSGGVYDTDKYMWLQGRQVYMFGKLYNHLQKNQSWLDMAKLGADFINKYGFDPSGDVYFALSREGKPLSNSWSIYSDYFCSMGLAQYAKASGDVKSKERALEMFRRLPLRWSNPEKQFSTHYPGTRDMDGLTLHMIEINYCLEMQDAFPELDVEERVNHHVSLILNTFLDKYHGLFHENVSPDQAAMNHYDGRLICPGHSIECAWFIMEAGLKFKRQDWIDQACEVMMNTLEFGWDKEFGGLYYFMDIEGKPVQQLDWDHKLWWVHNESQVALLLAYTIKKEEKYWKWFEKMDEYSWRTFADPAHGEWFGYKNRRGEVLLNMKGGKWKGCFHVPRFLFKCDALLGELV